MSELETETSIFFEVVVVEDPDPEPEPSCAHRATWMKLNTRKVIHILRFMGLIVRFIKKRLKG